MTVAEMNSKLTTMQLSSSVDQLALAVGPESDARGPDGIP